MFFYKVEGKCALPASGQVKVLNIMTKQSRIDLIDSTMFGLMTKANVGQEHPSRNCLLCQESVHTIIELCQWEWESNKLPKMSWQHILSPSRQ